MPRDPDALPLDVAPEVAAALDARQPVVALESTIISHGMPWPRNVETALAAQDAVRGSGATPATIAILGGRIRVGLADADIEHLGKLGQDVVKTSRRDLPFVVARGADGATTVAATMIVARRVGIRVFATGGIGGVHRGAESTMDVSADLEELAQTPVAVVCAGIKSVLDIGRTLEYLETAGVPVVGYRTDRVPAFYARFSEHAVDYRADSVDEIARAIAVQDQLGLRGGMVIANPAPRHCALEPELIEAIIQEAHDESVRLGITGKQVTPYLLDRIAERTSGRSLDANVGLVIDNSRLAAMLAVALADAG